MTIWLWLSMLHLSLCPVASYYLTSKRSGLIKKVAQLLVQALSSLASWRPSGNMSNLHPAKNSSSLHFSLLYTGSLLLLEWQNYVTNANLCVGHWQKNHLAELQNSDFWAFFFNTQPLNLNSAMEQVRLYASDNYSRVSLLLDHHFMLSDSCVKFCHN